MGCSVFVEKLGDGVDKGEVLGGAGVIQFR